MRHKKATGAVELLLAPVAPVQNEAGKIEGGNTDERKAGCDWLKQNEKTWKGNREGK